MIMYKIVNDEKDIPSDRCLTQVTWHSCHNSSKSFFFIKPNSTDKDTHFSLEL